MYRYLYCASHGASQTEALSVHFSSRQDLRGERDEERGAEKINERKGGVQNSMGTFNKSLKDVIQKVYTNEYTHTATKQQEHKI